MALMLTACLYSLTLTSTKSVYEEDKELVITLKMFPDTITVDGDFLRFEGIDKGNRQKVLVDYKLKTEQEKMYFEQLTHTLELETIVQFSSVDEQRNLNGFDYSKYLALHHTTSRLSISSINSSGAYHKTWYDALTLFREVRLKAFVHIERTFSPLSAAYMKNLLFGFKDNGPGSFQETWKKLGMMHIFSLSGMHIIFFITFFRYMVLRLGITHDTYFYIEFIYVGLLMCLTGLGTGMVRAGLQTLTNRMNAKHDWYLSKLDCWSVALLINTLFQPYVLLTIGGQLTYYLTFMIIFTYPIVTRYRSFFLSGIVFNCLLSLYSLPFVWYYFFEWNGLTFIVNLIISPIIFIVVLPILLTVFLVSCVLPNLTYLWVERGLLRIQVLGDWLGSFSLFHQTVGKISIILMCLICFSHIVLIIELDRTRGNWNKRLILIVMLTMLVPFQKYIRPTGMVAFVDIGQGDSIFIQLPFHRGNYLIDTGGSLAFNTDEEWRKRENVKGGADYTLIPFLKGQGVDKLDHVFITHAHEDHFGDLLRVNEEIKIGTVHYTEGTGKQPNFIQTLNGLHDKTKKDAVQNQTMWHRDSLTLESLYPNHDGDGQNDDSLVLLASINQTKLLLTGDLEKNGEEELLKKHPDKLNVDILKAGHHGSKTSSHLAFLEQVNPQQTIISCGKNNRYHHPSKETLDNLDAIGTKVFRTDRDGMIYSRWLPFSKGLGEFKTIKDEIAVKN